MVLDACALIAFFNDEPGAETVAAILQDVSLIEVAAANVLEIAYDAVRTTGRKEAAGEIIEAVRQLPVDIRWELDQGMIERAAQLKANHRISLADSIALALAISLKAPLATSDHHEFDALQAANISRFLWIR